MSTRARKKTSRTPAARPRTAPPAPIEGPEPVEIPVAPETPKTPLFLVSLADCLNVTVVGCRSVTVSDNGACVQIDGDGHGDGNGWRLIR